MSLLKDEVLKLKRRYKFVTNNRYFYNRKSDLKKKVNCIISWSIVQSKNRGVFIFKFPFIRKRLLSVDDWRKLWSGKFKGFESLHSILTETVLPNISVKFNDNWRYIDLIGWTIDDRKRFSNRKVVVHNQKRKAKNVKRV